MNCLIIVGPLITGRRESEVEIRIRTYSDSVTSVHRGAERIEAYTSFANLRFAWRSIIDVRDLSNFMILDALFIVR